MSIWIGGRRVLLAGAAVVVAGAGPTQPQEVAGPCEVRQFFIVALGTSNTEMTIENTGQACRFTLFNPNLQIFQSAALLTSAPSHGRAEAGLIDGGRMAAVSYTPAPGYVGVDKFTATIEPSDKAVVVTVSVRPKG